VYAVLAPYPWEPCRLLCLLYCLFVLIYSCKLESKCYIFQCIWGHHVSAVWCKMHTFLSVSSSAPVELLSLSPVTLVKHWLCCDSNKLDAANLVVEVCCSLFVFMFNFSSKLPASEPYHKDTPVNPHIHIKDRACIFLFHRTCWRAPCHCINRRRIVSYKGRHPLTKVLLKI